MSSQFPQVRSVHTISGALAFGAFLGWMAATQTGQAKIENVCAAPQISVQEAFSPRQGATELVVQAVDQAKQSVHVAAYSFTSHPIAQALIRARERGIDVRVVMDEKEAANQSVERELSEGSVPVRLNGHYAIMHNKFMVIDGVTLETGSFNYTHSAEERNAENALVLHEVPNLTAAYIRQWDKLWGEAVAVRGGRD